MLVIESAGHRGEAGHAMHGILRMASQVVNYGAGIKYLVKIKIKSGRPREANKGLF